MLYQSHFITRSAGCAPDTGRVPSKPLMNKRRNIVFYTPFILFVISSLSFAETDHSAMFPQIKDVEAVIQHHNFARIIVGLNISFKPEGELKNPQDVVEQQSKIATAQTQLVSQLKDIFILDEKLFTTIPYLSVNANKSVLNLLVANPLVKSIQLDEMSSLSVPNNNMEVIQ
jgi:hypothetical protein